MLKFEELPEINSERWLSLEDFDGEEWKDIECAKGSYMVSNYGRIKSLERIRNNRYSRVKCTERIRRLGYNMKGYPSIKLTVNSKYVYIGSIHRLVARAFISNPSNKPQIDHINTIRTDNRVCNLRYVTNRENAYNPITAKKVHDINGRKGIRHHTEATKNKIREKLKNGASSGFRQVGELSARSKPIVQLTLEGKYVKEWPCSMQATKELGGHISSCCRGERKSAAGYKWMFKTDYEQLKT